MRKQRCIKYFEEKRYQLAHGENNPKQQHVRAGEK